METEDYFQTAEVRTIGDQVETDDYADVIYKTPVTPAVAAAKQSYLGRVYLDWAKVAGGRGSGDGARAGSRGAAAGLAHGGVPGFAVWVSTRGVDGADTGGWVYVGLSKEIEGMYMQGREQK